MSVMASARIGKVMRSAVEAEAEAQGVPVENRACPDCWRDLAARLYKSLKDADAKPEDAKGGRALLVDGLDVYFRGRRVNNTTITTAEDVEWLVSKGFPKLYLTADEDK